MSAGVVDRIPDPGGEALGRHGEVGVVVCEPCQVVDPMMEDIRQGDVSGVWTRWVVVVVAVTSSSRDHHARQRRLWIGATQVRHDEPERRIPAPRRRVEQCNAVERTAVETHETRRISVRVVFA